MESPLSTSAKPLLIEFVGGRRQSRRPAGTVASRARALEAIRDTRAAASNVLGTRSNPFAYISTLRGRARLEGDRAPAGVRPRPAPHAVFRKFDSLVGKQ